MGFGVTTLSQPVAGCFMCPDNNLLAFEPLTIRGADGYVVPGSMPVTVTVDDVQKVALVPFPFTALVVPFEHPTLDEDGFGYTFPNDWTRTFRKLLHLVPGLHEGGAWSGIHQVGYAAGARIPKAVTDAGIPAHPWEWIVYGRDQFAERDDTLAVGLATIVHRSRRDAGEVPSDQQLYDLWKQVSEQPEPILTYYRRLLAFAA